MRPILLYLLTEIQACEYYGGQDIKSFTGFMSDADLETFVIDRHAMLMPEDRERILKIAQSYRDRSLR
jgi:hypothetical protein